MAIDDVPVFYFDLGSPYSYLAAFRIERMLRREVDWRPIWAAPVVAASGRDWRHSFTEARARREEIERRAMAYGMPPWRWPKEYEPATEQEHAAWQPANTLNVMRLATFAQHRGVGPQFALRVFAVMFNDGHLIATVDDAVVAAAVACGIDEQDARAAPADPEVKASLRAANDEAIARGVVGIPTVAVADQLFWGDDRLEDAAAAVATTSDPVS